MSDNLRVRDFLRKQFARMHMKLDLIAGDVTNLKVRMSDLEAEAGYVRLGPAEVNGRLDRPDERVARIEWRLDLADAPA